MYNLRVSRKLLVASIATFVFVLIELAAGIFSNSLSLIGDSFHNFTDTLALLLALFAVRLERRPATTEKSYGYQRAGVITAFINAATLVAFTGFIFVEAFTRFHTPKPVNANWMLVTAAMALVLNASITFWLRNEGRSDLNIHSAVLHMLGDAFSSAGIIMASILIRRTGMGFWDPAMSLIIGVLILWSSWGVLKERVIALLLVLASFVPMTVATILVAFGNQVEDWMISHLVTELGPVILALWTLGRWLISMLTSIAVLALIYHFGLPRWQQWYRVLPGATLATVVWFGSTKVFGWYVTKYATYSLIYGPLGAAIALLVWMYIVSLVVLVGAEFNALVYPRAVLTASDEETATAPAAQAK